MKKYFIIVVFMGFCKANYCEAQPISKGDFGQERKKATSPKATNKNKPAAKLPNTKQKISIIANDDCTLKINDIDSGMLKSGQKKILLLANGTYKIEAIKSVTHDPYLVELNVKGVANTVQIDFTSAVIKRQKILDSLDLVRKAIEEKTAKELIIAKSPDTSAINNRKPTGKSIVNLITSNMIPIPSGSFTMGKDLGDYAEGPAHTVTIDQIAFSRYEVTQLQWETIMGTNPSVNEGCENCPVENISFNEVDSFLVKINQIGSKKFRLPTEAEWEYVAGKVGDSVALKPCAWYKVNSEKKTHPVGTKQPNAFGIYDISGNVAEWCSDWYALKYYKKKPIDNPTGPASGKDKSVRGGSYDDSESTLRVSYRAKQNPGSKKATIGVRLVMELK